MGLDGRGLSEWPWPSEVASAALTLARRANAGGTLWCWSPEWGHHAEHVAVEFVHPVVVGTRALPAEVVSGPDPAPALRALSRPGDVLVIVAAPTAAVAELLQRAPAWGLATVWIGTGERPAANPADHMIWCKPAPEDHGPGVGATSGSDRAGQDVFDGEIVCTYHVLWELTHVCFEHPGLLIDPSTPDCADADGTGYCVTCADEGRLAEVVDTCLAGAVRVRTPSGLEEVDVTLVAPVEAGDLVLVHAGVAIARMNAS